MIEVIALPLKEDSGKGHTIVEGNRAAVNAPVLETLSLTRRFGGHTAVDSLTASVKRGEVFGFCCRQPQELRALRASTSCDSRRTCVG